VALLFCDGFEVQFADNTTGLWDGVVAESPSATKKISYSDTQKRTGSGALRIQQAFSSTEYRNITKGFAAKTEIFAQVAVFLDSSVTLNKTHNPFLFFHSSSGTNQITVAFDITTHFLRIFRGPATTGTSTVGTILGNGTIPLLSDAWTVVEIHLVISDTVGVVQAKVDGILDIDLSGQDTNHASASVDVASIGLGLPVGGTVSYPAYSLYFDDFILHDTIGSVANSWPGQAGVHKLNPTGVGNYTQWTKTGASNDADVDDLNSYGGTIDSDTTRLSHAVVGERASVTLSDTTAAGTVGGVQIVTFAKQSEAGSNNLGSFVRISTTDYDQTAYTPDSAAYNPHSDILTTNPATSAAWATAALDALEIGWKVVA